MILGLGLVVLATACNDPLQGLGEVSQEIVHGATTTTLTVPVDGPGDSTPASLTPAATLSWQNDAVSPGVGGQDPQVVVAGVWNRGNGVERFIQASRAEIARALPGVVFPELVPAEVEWVSSQLVFDVASASLDADTAAAFGMWTVEPYSVTRSDGQAAVFYVGLASGTDPVDGIRAIPVEDGVSLEWSDAFHSYRLFCRTWVEEADCWRAAESATPLLFLVPAGT
jgi:hypothetical protein